MVDRNGGKDLGNCGRNGLGVGMDFANFGIGDSGRFGSGADYKLDGGGTGTTCDSIGDFGGVAGGDSRGAGEGGVVVVDTVVEIFVGDFKNGG